MSTASSNVPRVALSRQEAALSLGMSLDSFERHVQPELRLIRRGKLRLVPRRRTGAVGERERRVGVQTSASGLASAVLMATGIRVRHSRNCTSTRGWTLQLQADLPGAGVRHPDRSSGVADLPHAERREAVAPGRPGRAAPRHDAAADGEDDRRGGRGPDQRRPRRDDPRPRRQAVQAVDRPRLRATPPRLRHPRPRRMEAVELQRRDVQDFVDGLRSQGLSPSTIANILDPLRVIFRRAIRRDEVADRPDREPRPSRHPRPARPDRAARGGARATRRAPRLREGVLGGRPVLRPPPRRAARPPVDQRRLREPA